MSNTADGVELSTTTQALLVMFGMYGQTQPLISTNRHPLSAISLMAATVM